MVEHIQLGLLKMETACWIILRRVTVGQFNCSADL